MNATPQRIVITGAAGRIGESLRPRLRAPGRELVLVDRAAPAAPAHGSETILVGDIRDRELLREAVTGADLVVHLAGHPGEREWQQIVDVNIGGTQALLQASAETGVRRVLLASSVHAAGFQPVADPLLIVRPDTFYGVGKVAAEALGSLYADRFGLTVVSARIANFTDRPTSRRGLSLWFSPDDAARLVEACARLHAPGHHLVWGVSRNTRGVLDLEPGRRIGFEPIDDAEVYATGIGESADAEPIDLLGAGFTTRPLGERPR